MAKRTSRRISKSKAVQNALGQLGWHAGAKDVVVFLANRGIEVSDGLIHKVKLESLKDSSGVIRQQAKVRQVGGHSARRRIRKVPDRRPYRK